MNDPTNEPGEPGELNHEDLPYEPPPELPPTPEADLALTPEERDDRRQAADVRASDNADRRQVSDVRASDNADRRQASDVVMAGKADRRNLADKAKARSDARGFRLGLAILFSSIVVIIIGSQAYLATTDNEQRDKDQEVYDACLTEWGTELWTSVAAFREANVELEKARDRKDAALDAVFDLVNEARAYGDGDAPPELIKRYRAAIAERVEAQQEFTRAKAVADEKRKANPLPKPPKAECAHVKEPQ